MPNVLGRAIEYPKRYDSSLLVRIPRAERRKGYSKMAGVDVWICYEVSFLNKNGLPQYCILKLFNYAENPFIFESKSLKLYFYSLNNERFDSLDEFLRLVSKDLSKVAGGEVRVDLAYRFDTQVLDESNCLEAMYPDISCKEYNVNPKLLKVTKAKKYEEYSYWSDLLRSNCEITNQPDWGRISIKYASSTLKVLPDSLLKYLVSFRQHQEFHEPTCERIYQTLFKLIKPVHLQVTCQYTRRGGIEINPIRASGGYESHLVRAPQQ